MVRDVTVGKTTQYTVKDIPHLYGIELQRTIDRNTASHSMIVALREVLRRKKSKTTELSRVLIAGFAAAWPYISGTHIEHLLAIGRITLLWEVGAVLGFDNDNGDLLWLDDAVDCEGRQLSTEKIADSSLSSNVVADWVFELAVTQTLLF